MAQGTVPIGENRLLGLLDRETRKILEPNLTKVALTLKKYIYKPGKPFSHVYFPLNGVISLLAPVDVGPSVEVATIGNEGMAGLPLFLGTNRSPGSCFSQVPGEALRMSAAQFRVALARNGAFTRVLYRYAQALMIQISQGTACNRAHSIQQRCARWLLMTHDRVRTDDFLLTQEFLGQMLGSSRNTVGVVAAGLQRAGYITYVRGRVTVLDRKGLESASCVCYSIVRKEYDRLLSHSSD